MMIAPTLLLEPGLWAEATFGTAQLGDPRRTRRAVAIAEALAREPGASLPQQLHDPAALEATYRFLHSQVSYEALLQPHVEHTREEMGQVERVLLIQDTTEVDYQRHPTTTGLGGPAGRNQVAARPARRARVAGLGTQCACHRARTRRDSVDPCGRPRQRYVSVPASLCGAGL